MSNFPNFDYLHTKQQRWLEKQLFRAKFEVAFSAEVQNDLNFLKKVKAEEMNFQIGIFVTR